MNKKWMPITAGVLDIISGVLGIGSGIPIGIMMGFVSWVGKVYGQHIVIGLSLLIIAGTLAFVGGAFAIRSKRWRLALAGAIAAFISCLPVMWFYCIDGFYVLHSVSTEGPLWWIIIVYLYLILAVILPIAAIVLTVLSRKQFE